MKKEVKPCEEIPSFYGVAYFNYQYNRAICYPLGVNLIVALWRILFTKLKNPFRESDDGKIKLNFSPELNKRIIRQFPEAFK